MEVVLCCHNWNYSVKLGEFDAGNILSLWQSPDLVSLRQSHLRGEYDCTPICYECREWAEPSELDSYLRLDVDDLFRVF